MHVVPGVAGHLNTSAAPSFHVILLGMTGHMFRPIQQTLLLFGLSQSRTASLIKKLCTHSIRCAHNLISLRRHLEWCSVPFKPP